MPEQILEIQHPMRSFVLLLAANFLWMIGLAIYLPFLGLFLRSYLGANPVEVGLFSSTISLSAIITTLIGGPLTGRFGEKPIIIISWVSIVPAPLIYIFAPSWHWTLLGAISEGAGFLGAGAFGSYISQITGRERRGLAYGLNMASYAAAGIPGPVLGGFFITNYGYYFVFLIAAVLYFGSTLVVALISPVPKHSVETTSKLPQSDWARKYNIPVTRIFWAVTLLYAVVLTLSNIGSIFLPLFLVDRFGLNEFQIGIMGMIANASASVFGPLLGMAGDHWSHTPIVAISVFGWLGFYGLLLICPDTILLMVVYIVQGLSAGLYPLLGAIISRNLTKAQLPNAFVIFESFSRILTPFSPLIGGIGYAINPSLPLLMITLFLPLPLLMVPVLSRIVKKEKQASSSSS
ncbi:MAG: MFS transporter [Promethearchaeota archaeon]